jgi:hypothetical protein
VTTFTYCAKKGHPKEPSRNYVCGDHFGVGLYGYCAKCGTQWHEPSRDYVCWDCLSRLSVVERARFREEFETFHGHCANCDCIRILVTDRFKPEIAYCFNCKRSV